MTKLALVFVGLVTLGACGKGGDVVAGLQGFKDKMCACKDAACAKTVDDALVQWRLEAMKAAGSRDAWEKTMALPEYEKASAEYKKCETAATAAPPAK